MAIQPNGVSFQGDNSLRGDTDPLANALRKARTLGISGDKPYHYGFNCRPRQVRSYEIERTVEAVVQTQVAEAIKVLADRIAAKHDLMKAGWVKRLDERNSRSFTMSVESRRAKDTSLGRTSDRLYRMETALRALGQSVHAHYLKDEVNG